MGRRRHARTRRRKRTRRHSRNRWRRRHTHRYRGMGGHGMCLHGGSGDPPQLAYPSSDVPKIPNPYLAYTGNGRGGGCGNGMCAGGGGADDTFPVQNINAEDKTIPNTGPDPAGFDYIVPQIQRGGWEPSSAGTPYPAGLVGKPWTPNPSGWPGVDGVAGDRNYLAHNNYKQDPQLAMVSTGGGRRLRGGTVSNFVAQDLLNLSRQFGYGAASAYNTLAGIKAPANPMPWKE